MNGNLSAANLASNAVTTAKITDSNVTTAKIADGAVTSEKVSFSGTVTTLANAGTAGGTIWYTNLGGIKLLWFATGAIERSGVGQTSATVTLPGSFFSTIQSITGSWKVTADGRNVAYHTSSSTSSITIQIYNYTAGTGGISTFHGFVIGT